MSESTAPRFEKGSDVSGSKIGECNPYLLNERAQFDILTLHAQLRGAYAETTFADFARKNTGKDRTLITAEASDGGIDAMIILDVSSGVFWIRHNVVKNAAAGMGLGKKMLDAVIEMARTRGAREVFLHCNPIRERDTARALYMSRGFENVGIDTEADTVTEKFVLKLV